jgi:CheY-like chemotaxis protein
MTDQTCQPPSCLDSGGGENVTVLVVDDDLVILEAVADLLELSGYRVLTAMDGAVALQTMEGQAPDVIVADIMMPRMDGRELREAVRLNPEWAMIPFIFLTAHRDSADSPEGIAHGDDDYVTKPFEPGDLLAAIETSLKSAPGTNTKR